MEVKSGLYRTQSYRDFRCYDADQNEEKGGGSESPLIVLQGWSLRQIFKVQENEVKQRTREDDRCSKNLDGAALYGKTQRQQLRTVQGWVVFWKSYAPKRKKQKTTALNKNY